jgi:hypothetical protein
MLRAILWKEWRQQGLFFLAILLLAGLAIGTTALTLPQEWANLAGEPILRLTLSILFLTLVVSQAVVSGALLFAGEREDGTLSFLDVHSGRRLSVWSAKMIAGVTIAIASALILGIAMVGFGIASPMGLPLAIWVAIDVLVWTAVASAFCETTFKGIGLALLILFFVAGWPIGLLTNEKLANYFGIKLPLLALALAASWAAFCQSDLLRRDPATLTRPTSRLAVSHWLRVSVWMQFCQQWLGLVVVAGTLVLGLFDIVPGPWNGNSQAEASLTLPIFAFLIGSVGGWCVFAVEQENQTERFLGDQRLPRGRVWLGKVGPWLVVVLLACWPIAHLGAVMRDLFIGRPGATEFSFCLIGFGFAQFFGMWTRKAPVMIFLTLLVAAPLALVWYAPLFAGMPAWRAWVIPAILLAATRWDVARWTSGRLHDLRGMLWSVGIAVTCGSWTAANLAWREYEVPNVGNPFATVEGMNELREANGGRHGSALHDASEEAFRRLGESRPLLRLPGSLDATWNDPAIDFPTGFYDTEDLIDFVAAFGYPDEPGQIQRFVDDLFKGDWPETFRRVARETPDRLPFAGTFKPGPNHVTIGGSLFVLRAAERFAAGKRDEALDHLETALAAVRHLLHKTYGLTYRGGLSVQAQAVDLSETMLRSAGSDAAFLKRLGLLLQQHESRLPPFAAVVRTTYANREQFERNFGISPPIERVHQFLMDTATETARDERMMQALFAGLDEQPASGVFPLPTLHPRTARWRLPSPSDCGLPTERGPASNRTREQWEELNRQTWNHAALPLPLVTLLGQRDAYASGLLHLRGVSLAGAAARFQLESGHQLESLEQLTPRVLERILETPYGHSFEYRVTAGVEKIERVERVRERPFSRTVPAGQGLIWSRSTPMLAFLVPRS